VPVDDRVKLPENSFYDWELIGCRVETTEGQTVGDVDKIVRTGKAELLSIVDAEGHDRLVPMVGDIVIDIDKEQKLIRIDPPEGLLEL